MTGAPAVNQLIAIIREEQGRYGVSFPDLPGCVSGGISLEEAMRRGREALRVHVESMIEGSDRCRGPLMR